MSPPLQHNETKEVGPMVALTTTCAGSKGKGEFWERAGHGATVLGWVLLGVLFLAVMPVGHLDALKAAGAFKGEAIPGVQGIVDKLEGNVVWLGGTVMALAIAVVGIMFMAGHSRAHDLALKAILGMFILASVSGLAA